MRLLLPLSLIAFFFAAGIAFAGFRHPVEQTGAAAAEVAGTQVRSPAAATRPNGRMMPDRMQAMRPAAPAQVARPAPGKAPPLPAAARFEIPDFHGAPLRDGLATQRPDELRLRNGVNRTQIHSFLRQVRGIPLPSREYGGNAKGREIAARYRAALEPTRFVSYRTPYSLSLEKTGKLPGEPALIQYENAVRRLDSLFAGLDGAYPKAALGLWRLSESPSNPRHLRARDALFAGLLSARAGWQASAGNLFAASALGGIDREERYLRILWAELDSLSGTSHVDRVVARVNAHRVARAAPAGDAANFALAKRALSGAVRPPLAPLPPAETFARAIRSTELRDRLSLLEGLRGLHAPKAGDRSAALTKLRELEAGAHEGTRQEARLALARTTLQGGDAAAALALYKGVTKTPVNRLQVLSEQGYAEYLVGDHQASLGKSIGLQSAYFQYGFAPDAHFVEILSRQARCDFGGAEEGVKRFLSRYEPELGELEALLKRAPEPAAYYPELVGYFSQAQPKRYQRYLLRLDSVMENQKAMNGALEELAKLDELGLRRAFPERPEGWSEFTGAMRASWSERSSELRAASARAALQEASYLAKRLRGELKQVELLELDISTAAARNYHRQSALNFPARKEQDKELAEGQVRWPFEQEVWEDEIEFLRTKNPTKCAPAAVASN